MMLDGFGSFEDGDEDEEAVYALVMPDTVATIEREAYQVGKLHIPDWLMDGIARQHILFRNDACDVLVRGRYIRAHKNDYIIRLGSTYTIDTPKEVQ